MSVTHRIAFAFEILLAELIFLFPCEKRQHFFFRYLLGTLATVAASYLFLFYIPTAPEMLMRLLRIILVFSTSIAAMCFCFNLNFLTVASACAAGYAVEHLTFQIVKIISMTTSILPDSLFGLPRWEAVEYVLFPPIYLVLAATLGVYSAKCQCFQRTDRRLTLIFFAIVILTMGFTRIADAFGDSGSISVSLYAIACCVMALAVQLILFHEIDLQYENDTIRLLWQEDQRQYELTKKTIDTINIKHHDLKHRLAEMNAMLSKDDIRSIEEAVNVYDSKIKTGNEALDVLLTKNSLVCKEEGISLSYTGNGADFSFMSTMDVYSLFGNAVDNAIEAVRKVEDPEKKIVDIVTERTGAMITVVVTNYFSDQLQFFDGMPATTKKEEEGFHGFGMKSMKILAEKYHGSVHARTEGDVFVLTICIFDVR